MEAYQRRVIVEKEELDEKIKNLQKFVEGSLYSTLPIKERVDLDNQLNVMTSYSAILGRRIKRF